MKIVISDPKSGRSKSFEVSADKSAVFAGRKVSDIVDATFIDMPGYRFKITGGSDSSGFPVDRSIQGTGKVRVLKRIAMSGKRKGQYKRSTVRGGILTSDVAQINMMVTEYGEKRIEDIFGPAKENSKKEEGRKGFS